MGKFTDRLKDAFRFGNNKLPKELLKKHGLRSDAKLKTKQEVGHNMYMIRDASNPRLLIHFEDGEYIVREAIVMACVWTWQTGHEFIKSAPHYNLELVHHDEALKAFTAKEQRNPHLK
jgi:hypothetical protein